MVKMKIIVMVASLALLGGACAQDDAPETEAEVEQVSLELGSVPDSVEGNVVSLPVEVEGIEIVAPDGDDSGDSGHFHVFIDRRPVEEGEIIPREAGVVHSADNPIQLYGLEPGEHEFTVVLGNGLHERILEPVSDSVTVDVEGPSVDGTAPATIEEGEDLTVELAAEGIEIVAADGDTSGDSGHFHVLVDPEEPPAAGEVIPEPEEGKVYHTTEDSVTVPDLASGDHVIWVVIGDGTHEALDPPVMDRIAVTVG